MTYKNCGYRCGLSEWQFQIFLARMTITVAYKNDGSEMSPIRIVIIDEAMMNGGSRGGLKEW